MPKKETDEDLKKFGDYIKDLRMKRGWTISQVAEKLELSINYVSQLERGVRRATDELIEWFSKLYNIDEDKLYREAGRVPSRVEEELKTSPTLQKAISYLSKSKISDSKKKELEKEILDVFAEFLNVHSEDILDGEIAREIRPSNEIFKDIKKEE